MRGHDHMARMTEREIQGTREAPESGVLRFPPQASFPPSLTGEDILAALYATWFKPLSIYASKRDPGSDGDDLAEEAFLELWRKYLAHGRRPHLGCENTLLACVRDRAKDERF